MQWWNLFVSCRLRRPATRSQLKCIPHCNLTSSRALTFPTFLFPFLGQMSAGAGCSPRKRSEIIFHGSDPDESSQVIVIRYHSPMIFTFSAVSRNCSRCNRRLLNYSWTIWIWKKIKFQYFLWKADWTKLRGGWIEGVCSLTFIVWERRSVENVAGRRGFVRSDNFFKRFEVARGFVAPPTSDGETYWFSCLRLFLFNAA